MLAVVTSALLHESCVSSLSYMVMFRYTTHFELGAEDRRLGSQES